MAVADSVVFDVDVVNGAQTVVVPAQASVVSLLGLTILSIPASVGAQTVNIIACAP